MIRIIESFYEENNIKALAEEIQNELLHNNEKIYVIVPEQFTLFAENTIVSHLDSKGLFYVEVLSPKRIAHKIIRNKPIKVLDSCAKNMILSHTLKEVKDELTIFKKTSHTLGFAQNLGELLDEMRKNKIQDNDLTITDETIPKPLKSKTEDIKKIYSKYNSLLPENFVDNEELINTASTLINDADFLKDSTIFYFGFHTFDKSTLELIEKISTVAKSQSFIITGKSMINSNSDAPFEIIKNTISALNKITITNNLKFEYLTPTLSTAINSDIKFLCENLYSSKQISYCETPKHINIYRGENPYDEVHFTASKIRELINEGARFKDFLVVCSDTETYKSIIKETFTKAKINFFTDEKKEISSINPIKAFLFLINILDSNFVTEDIISFLKTGYSTLTEKEVFLIENYCSKFKIKGNMWNKAFTKNDENDIFDLNIINNIRENTIIPILEFKKNFNKEQTTENKIIVIYNFIKENGFLNHIKNNIENFKLNEDYTTANEYAQMYNIIMNILNNLYILFKDKFLTSKDFKNEISYAIATQKIGIIPSKNDSVMIADLERSRSTLVKYIFILGINESMLPKSFSDTPIFTNHEKELLINKKQINLTSTNEYKIKQEKYLLTTLIGKAKKNIFLSYSEKSTSGEELFQSCIISRTKELFPNITEETFENNVAQLIARNYSKEESFSGLAKFISKHEFETNEEEIAFWDKTESLLNQCGFNTKPLNNALNYRNDALIKNKNLLNKLYQGEISTSITQLEEYASCPFKYFIRYVIKPNEKKEYKIDSLDIGSLLHKTIEKFSEYIINGKVNPHTITEQDIEKITKEISLNLTEKYNLGLFKNAVNKSLLEKRLIRESINMNNSIINEIKSSKFKIKYSEADFSNNGTFEPIKFITQNGTDVFLRGKIDRIDTYTTDKNKEYIKIVDYKSSNKNFDFIKTYSGLSLQLPIYLKALTTANGNNPAGLFYLAADDKKTEIKNSQEKDTLKEKNAATSKLSGYLLNDLNIINAMDINLEKNSYIKGLKINKDKTLSQTSPVISEEQFKNMLNYSIDKAKELTEHIVSGDINVTPYFNDTSSTCKYCKYLNICQFNHEFKGNKMNYLPNGIEAQKKCKDEILNYNNEDI